VRPVRRSARRKLFVYRTNSTMSHVLHAKVSVILLSYHEFVHLICKINCDYLLVILKLLLCNDT